MRIRGHAKTYKVFHTRADGRTMVVGFDSSKTYWYRIVAQNMIGRELRDDEEVHHINGDCTDDRPENLEVLTKTEHRERHGELVRQGKSPCVKCGADRTQIKKSPSRTLCPTCYSQLPHTKERAKRHYEENRERIKAQRDARRARQRALGLKVT